MSDVRITRLMRLEARVAQALLNLFLRMGPARASSFAGRFCRFIGPFLPVSKIADKNLQLAMPDLNAHGTCPDCAWRVGESWPYGGRTPAFISLAGKYPQRPGF
ncbi:Lipid A biosynthesis lauroyl acyltransferase [Acetobacter malorum]|uniref:Lipid A biosynthesis lauroyl acyltransferase n=1 Tax=Acetobacter malorum TaxID=178901 RepID=A0A177GAK9_9PROT|nr:Lipid A biosynthesis lauroyl acyltransferase [Acetobacter malorum]